MGPGPAPKLRIETDREPNRIEAFENPRGARAIDLALKAVDVAKVNGRDGGNDEGFAGHRRWSVRSLTLEGEESARVCRIWHPQPPTPG